MTGRWLQTVIDWTADADALRRRRYGVIETSAGQLAAVHLRPWPKLLSLRELWPVGDDYHVRGPADRCRLYYNQPLGHGTFLALKYIETTTGTSYATFLAAVETLDAIAAIKGSDALVCDVQNRRISDRLLARLGWEPHAASRWHRNFIKRFYGEYPAAALRIVGNSLRELAGPCPGA